MLNLGKIIFKFQLEGDYIVLSNWMGIGFQQFIGFGRWAIYINHDQLPYWHYDTFQLLEKQIVRATLHGMKVGIIWICVSIRIQYFGFYVFCFTWMK